MGKGKEDRRIIRTKQLLHEALLELIIERGYEGITVQHIIDQANVGRSTFYAHFYDKLDLLQYGFDRLEQMLLAEQEDALHVNDDNNAPHFTFSLAMFRHAQDHYLLYKALVGKQSGAMVLQQMQDMLAALLRKERGFWVADKKQRISNAMIEQFIVSSYISLLTWWLDQDMPYTAEEMDRWFHTLTVPGIVAATQ